ncbi:MAG: protease complex subunit PrcB family protein [Mycobacterium leprae]
MRIVPVSDPQDRLLLSGGLMNTTVPLKNIDWTRELALIIDLGEKRTGGYGVEVRSLRVASPTLVEMVLRVIEPAPGAFVPQVLTHPFAVVPLQRQGLAAGPITVIARSSAGSELAREVVSL